MKSQDTNKFSEKKQAKKWFMEFDKNFNLEDAANLKFNTRFVRSNLQGLIAKDK